MRLIFFLRSLIWARFCLASFFFSFEAKLGLVAFLGFGLTRARSRRASIFSITSCLLSNWERCVCDFTCRNPSLFILDASFCSSSSFCASVNKRGIPDMEITDHHGLDLVYILSALTTTACCTKTDFPGNIYLHFVKVI